MDTNAKKPSRLWVLLPVLLMSIAARGEDLTGFERVLLPAWSPMAVHGAGGGTFTTEFTLYATRDVAVYPAARGLTPVMGSTLAEFCISQDRLPYFGPPPTPVDGHARILYFEPGSSKDLFFQYSLNASDGNGHVSETALPVVRESDFRTGSILILSVPTVPIIDFGTIPPRVTGFAERHRLRIYDLDHSGVLRVQVRFRSGSPQFCSWGPPTVVEVNLKDGDDVSYPFYADVDLYQLISPCIPGFSGNSPCVPGTRIVELTPMSATAKYWAMITSTRNDTQSVAVRVPQ